jgi:hypothetical protein
MDFCRTVKVQLVQVSLRTICALMIAAFSKHVQSAFRKRAFADEAACCCSPDEQPASTLDQALDDFCTRPAWILAFFSPDQIELVFQKESDVVIDGRRRDSPLRVRNLVQPVLDMHFRPTCEEHSQPYVLQRPTHRQELHDELCIGAAFRLVQGFDYQNKGCWLFLL